MTSVLLSVVFFGLSWFICMFVIINKLLKGWTDSRTGKVYKIIEQDKDDK